MSPGTRAQLFADEAGAVWRPDEARIARANLTRFLARVGIGDLRELHARSIEDPEWYWREVVDDLEVEFTRDFTQVRDPESPTELPRWFVDGTVNLAANCTDRNLAAGRGERVAIRWEDEGGASREVTFAELHELSCRFARYLRSQGIRPEDRVGLFMPMCPEAAAAFLGCARVGAVAVPAFSGYGPEALGVRLRAAEAKLVVTVDTTIRKGNAVDLLATAAAAAELAPSVEQLVVVHRGEAAPAAGSGPRRVDWEEALAVGAASSAGEEAEPLDPNHPLLIIYTSGTTGEPKGIIHSHGGFLVKVAHDYAYCFDIQEDDTLFWISDLGWVVGPLVITSGLFLGCTSVYYEGVPNHTAPDQLWQLIERNEVTIAGVSPTAVRSMMAAGDEWIEAHPLTCMRAFATAGEPWTPEAWEWLFSVVGRRRLPLVNYSGGTEISGGILTNYTVLPIAPCGFTGPVLGMDADAVALDGTPVRGETGELVVRAPWPGMTHGFWRDRERYLETYWSQIPGVWMHGDLVTIDDDGYWHIRGRSDDTLMVAGKRIGPAEVEAAVIAHPAVDEAAAIGVPDPVKGEHIVVFVTRIDRGEVDSELAAAISALVAERLGRALVPKTIIGVESLPKTRTAKIMRRLIKARYLGLPPGDLAGVEDLSSIDRIPERAA